MKDNNVKNFYSKQLSVVAEKLKNNRFETIVFEDIESAKEYIVSLVGSGKTIGIGGSQTVRSLNILEKLQQQNNKIITHTHDMSKEQRIQTWLSAQQADFYFASPQAITLKGELVFIDAYGNRGAAVIFGPKKIVLIAGYNKIVKDLDTAFWRIRNVAAVTNNIRLGRANPCVVSGKCEDCNSKTRICNVVTILYKKPDYSDYIVVLINEELGY